MSWWGRDGATGRRLTLTFGVAVGLAVGASVGLAVGLAVGAGVGLAVRLAVGCVGRSVRGRVGSQFGGRMPSRHRGRVGGTSQSGSQSGDLFGLAVGLTVGELVGLAVGAPVGDTVGLATGQTVVELVDQRKGVDLQGNRGGGDGQCPPWCGMVGMARAQPNSLPLSGRVSLTFCSWERHVTQCPTHTHRGSVLHGRPFLNDGARWRGEGARLPWLGRDGAAGIEMSHLDLWSGGWA